MPQRCAQLTPAIHTLSCFVAKAIGDSSMFLISLPLATTKLTVVVALTFATILLAAEGKARSRVSNFSKAHLQEKYRKRELFTTTTAH